jgi:hypothetical protein
MMGKKHWISFLTNIFFPVAPKESLLLNDQWTIYNDQKAIDDATPEGYKLEIRQMPAHTTKKHQPLDVNFFRYFKEFVRKIEDRVILDDLDVKLHDRDTNLRLISLVVNQFQAPRFKKFLMYAWKKAGYVDEHPGRFMDPTEYCYHSLSKDSCMFVDCDLDVFVKCAHCEMEMCFEHFFIKNHFCES